MIADWTPAWVTSSGPASSSRASDMATATTN